MWAGGDVVPIPLSKIVRPVVFISYVQLLHGGHGMLYVLVLRSVSKYAQYVVAGLLRAYHTGLLRSM